MLCVGHLGEQIEAAVGDGRRFGLDVRYSFDGPDPQERPERSGTPWASSARGSSSRTATRTCAIDYRAVQRAFEAARCPA